ncbi:DUF6452 family protein [uncultured Bacteroides sp.]|uniref:DUF6452 family protein n=1 Tax=uncultured Bacteroides sp. TaxID=162156 RepID=UPI0026219449|nr:DUF6452 family protein [uncultured Bacteroides sp.]
MKQLIRLLMLATVLLPTIHAVTSCSEEADCTLAGRAMLNCNLFTVDPESGNVLKDTLASLTVTAFATDSVIINNQTEVKNLSLPLRYTVDSTVLVFHYPEGNEDTIILRHTNTPYFLSMDCGYQMKQAITGCTYTRHTLDSIYISNPEADIYGTENLKLFY